MLVEFSVTNFRSFRGKQTLSLVAANDTALPDNCTPKGNLSLLKTTGLYGPNASGKSNLIKAAAAMRVIVLESAEVKPCLRPHIKPFLFDVKTREEPTIFEITFFCEDVRYDYGFSATTELIHDEWLIAYPKKKAQVWYERSRSKKTNKAKWEFGSLLRGEKVSVAEKTRDNALFLSVAAQWNNEQLTTVQKWFRDKLRIISMGDHLENATAGSLFAVNKNEEYKKTTQRFVTRFLQHADLGVSGVSVKEGDSSEISFPDDIPESIRKQIQAATLEVEVLHINSETGLETRLPLDEESDGTQRMFRFAYPWMKIVVEGITVFVDELEASLHPLLTRELIKFIQSPENNKKGAQLVFSTHDTTLLDPELLRRDQIWFVEKDQAGESRLYSLSDYEDKPRKGEPIQKGYLAGRYGAVPVLEAFGLK